MPKYVLNSLLAGIFSVTFTISPYAQAENKSPVEQIKTHIKDTKLTTSKSYTEYFARLSSQNTRVNPIVFKQIAESLSGEKYPNIQVQEFKYKGKDALKVMVQIGGELVVVEYVFHGDEVMKINGTVFKTADTVSSEAFEQKLKTIPAFHKVYQDFQKKVFKAATVPTYQQWVKLTTAQRAEYFLRHRQLLEAAYKVHNTGRFKVVDNSNKTFEEWVQSTFIGSEAYAGPAPGTIGAPGGQPAKPSAPAAGGDSANQAQQEAIAVDNAKKLTASMGNPDQFVSSEDKSRGPSCIVAGHARKWKGESCPWDGGSEASRKHFYDVEDPLSKECLTKGPDGRGGEGWIACKAVTYGFSGPENNYRPHCINTKVKTGTTENFNYATHGEGPCEKLSPLNTPEDKMRFIKNILGREKVPGAESLSVGPDPKCKDKKDGACPNVVITTEPKLFTRIMEELKGPIGKYIDSAKNICMEKEGSWSYKPPNPPKGKSSKPDPAFQDKACDALLKRSIAVQNLLTTQEETKPPVIAGPCEGWTPADRVEEVSGPNKDKICGCKDKEKCHRDEQARTCLPAGPGTAAAEPNVVTEPAPSATMEDGVDCSSYWTRMNPMVGGCSATSGDWFKTFLGVVGGICLSNAVFDTHITGLCASSKKTASNGGGGYVDPVTPPCPATGCTPTTPTNPTDPTAPRAEEVTNQNSPVYNPIQVPPR